MRVILHVDLDALFPSVDVREHPELKGKPVVVGADPKERKGRGVVSSAPMKPGSSAFDHIFFRYCTIRVKVCQRTL